jgi:hypothetical protein
MEYFPRESENPPLLDLPEVTLTVTPGIGCPSGPVICPLRTPCAIAMTEVIVITHKKEKTRTIDFILVLHL